MPMYDRRCEDGHTVIDLYEPIDHPQVACLVCGKPSLRVWLSKASGVIADEIPGGIWISHGICNEDGTPKKYYSKSEMAQEAKRRGLTNLVTHVTEPGTDKNKHTTRWV